MCLVQKGERAGIRLIWAVFILALCVQSSFVFAMESTTEGSGAEEPRACVLSVPKSGPSDAFEWQVSPSDRTVRGVMERWAEMTNWVLYWDSPYDYPIIEKVSYSNVCFGDALVRFLAEIANKGPGVRAVFYSGNRVLRIVPIRVFGYE